MELQNLTLLIVGITFAIYIFIAFWARAKNTNEFYIAGGDIHPIANGMATAADWMSAASFISMAGLISFFGYGGSVFLMGWTGGYVLLALLLAPYLRKHGSFTVPEFISDRYYSKTARVVAVVCLIIASVTYVIGQMKGIGVAFSRFLEVDYDQGLSIGMIIVFIYAVMGGMKGITYTQIAQYVIMIIAYTIPAIFISFMLTGNPIPQIGLGSQLSDGTYLLDKLDKIGLEKVEDELIKIGVPKNKLSILNNFLNITDIDKLTNLLGDSKIGVIGVQELKYIMKNIENLNLKSSELKFDVTLARGLDYYTGSILEVKSQDVNIGSIAGGGRYDDLTSVFGLDDVSGVGISFGIDRIYLVMEELGLFPKDIDLSTQVMFVNFGEKESLYCLSLLKELRNYNISAELYPSLVKIKKQMTYADNKGVQFVIMIGEDEMKSNTIRVIKKKQIKNL